MAKNKNCACCGNPVQTNFHFCEDCRALVKTIIDNSPELSKKNKQYGELSFKRDIAFLFINLYLFLSFLLEENIYTTTLCIVGQAYSMLSHLIITIRRAYLDAWLCRRTTILAKIELQKEGVKVEK